jgi:hypothetical protein
MRLTRSLRLCVLRSERLARCHLVMNCCGVMRWLTLLRAPLDLVVAVDTMSAHLPGAVLALSPFHADWPWRRGMEDSAW